MALAGSIVRSSDYGFPGVEADLAASYSVTTTLADVGLSLSLSTLQAGQSALVLFNAYTAVNTAVTTHNVIYYLNVDGSGDPKSMPFINNANLSGCRFPQGWHWRITLASAGAHTVKIQAQTSTTNGDFTLIGGSLSAVPCM